MRGPEESFRRARVLRRNMTLPEVVLWMHLKGRQLRGLPFRKQHVHGRYVLDFYCAPARLCVEVDGAHHAREDRVRRDEARDAALAGQGLLTLRFDARDVLDDERLDGVLRRIGDVGEARLERGRA